MGCRDVKFVSRAYRGPTDGPLVWPVGLIALGMGIFLLTGSGIAPLRRLLIRRKWLLPIVLFIGLGLYLWLAWRE